jgi:DNA-binding response OmpR family regulator
LGQLRPRVLIIEDDNELRKALSLFLEFEGFLVSTACNGQEGLDLLRAQPASHHPSLILLDWMMPVMNGAEFLQAWRAPTNPHDRIPIVMLSAARDRAGVDLATEFLEKPVDLDDLIQVARKYCSNHPTSALAAPLQ